MTDIRIPCPDQRDTRGPNYAGLYRVTRARLAEARSAHATSAAAARLAHYIARRHARADALIPGQIRNVRAYDGPEEITYRVEIATATPYAQRPLEDDRPDDRAAPDPDL